MGISTNKLKQVEEENFYLNQFLKAYKFEFISFKQGEDPPDRVLIKKGGHKIGIEIRGYHSKDIHSKYQRKQFEVEWDFLSDKIERVRKDNKLLNINCILTLKDNDLPNASMQDLMINELIQFIKETIHSRLVDMRKQEIFQNPFGKFLQLNKYLKRIRIKRAKSFLIWSCTNRMGASVGLSEFDLKEIIETKIKKMKRVIYSENWLLIHDGIELSQNFGKPNVEVLNKYDEVNRLIRNGNFDKVFLFQSYWNRILLKNKIDSWHEIKQGLK